MKTHFKSVIAFILTFAMIAVMLPVNIVKATDERYVYLSLEATLAGEGVIISPARLSYSDILAEWAKAGVNIDEDNLTVAQATYAFFKKAGIDTEPACEGSNYNDKSFYLSLVKNIRDNGDDLGEFDEGSTSGWMVSVDNEFIEEGAGNSVISNNSVIRWIYTIDYNVQDNSSSDDRSELYRHYADNITVLEADTDTKNYVDGIIEKPDSDASMLNMAYDAITRAKNGGKSSVDIKMNTVARTIRITDVNGNPVSIDDVGYDAKTYKYSNILLSPGDYTLTGVAADGETVVGSIVLNVGQEAIQSYSVYTVSNFVCGNAGWVEGSDYSLDVSIVSSEGKERVVTYGTSTDNVPKKTTLCFAGDSVKECITPLNDKTQGYLAKTVTNTISANRTLSAVTAPEKRYVKITVPHGATLRSGMLSNSFVYNDIQPEGEVVTDSSADTDTYSFVWAKGSSYYYRASMDNAVTYWNWGTVNDYAEGMDYAEYSVTKDDMHYEDADFNRESVIRELSENSYDVADIYMNINERGHINLSTGESYRLESYRNWQAIEGISNAKIAEPDFNYMVLDEHGNISNDVIDVVTTNNTAVCDIKAKKPGTAIVLVTYDAMINAAGMGNCTKYSAIWPENTGVFVVTVDKDNTVPVNMTINSDKDTKGKLAGSSIDAELDVLYYAKGSIGASYSFEASDNIEVSVMHPEYNNGKLTYNEYTASDVVRNNGIVTVNNLRSGTNIIKLVYGDSVRYQLIRAKEVEYTINYMDAEGETITADELTAGCKVEIVFGNQTDNGGKSYSYNGVYIPANKLAGIYNMSGTVVLTDNNGTEYKGAANQYQFAYTTKAQTVTVSIPDDYKEDKLVLKGSIMQTGFGSPYGSHRLLTHEKGKTPQFTAASCSAYMGMLPQITLNVNYSSSVRVVIEDYAAVSAGIEGASETGIILDTTVEAFSAKEAIYKALDNANIAYDDTFGYIASINNLGYVDGYPMSGWWLDADSDDCDNWGMNYISLKDDMVLTMVYSLDGGYDIAAAGSGLPTLKTLSVADKTYTFVTEVEYDTDYNATYTYKMNDSVLKGEGSQEKPFIVNVPDNATKYSYTTAADSKYVSVETSADSLTAGNKNELVVTSRGGRKAYYNIVVNTPAPTVTPAPTATPEPTTTPVPTATPVPTVKPAPTATPAMTATPIVTVCPESFEYKGLRYSVSGKNVICNGFAGKAVKKKLVIPSVVRYKGVSYKVTGISAKAFANCKKLTSITVGKNVIAIANKSFANCKKLKKITFKGSRLKTIAKNSFAGVSRRVKIVCNSVIKKKLRKVI